MEILPSNKITTNNLEKFYTYQYFNYSLQETKTEWDSLIIIPELSAIINIEVKVGPKDSGDKFKLLKNASDQTKQHFSFMQKLFGGMLSKDWVFVRAACVPYLKIDKDTKNPCVNCQKFIILEKDINDVSLWLMKLIEKKLVKSQNYDHSWLKKIIKLIRCKKHQERANVKTSDNYDQTSYEDLVSELIYHISIKESSKFDKLISDPLTVSRETEKALTGKSEGISGENDVPVYMLNNEQLQAVHSPAKFLIIDGDFGTGKTYVLKERAKKCVVDNSKKKLFYIDITALTHRSGEDFVTAESSVMNTIAVMDFYFYPNIKVITTKDLGISRGYPKRTDIINALNRFLRDNYCDHIFIDEIIIGEIVLPETIETICVNLKVDDKDISNQRAEWIETMKVNHNAVHVILTKNMRNSQKIIELAKALEQDSTQKISFSPDTNVMGNHSFYYRNVFDISLSSLFVAAINKYFLHEPKESVVILSKEYDSTELFQFLITHFSSAIPVVKDFKAYMKKPEGILVTNLEEFQGAQARNIIICDTDHISTYLRNAILRTMSLTIIILGVGFNKLNSSGTIEDTNLHEFIHWFRKAPKFHHYYNKDKHDISNLTMAILDKYNLLDQDESIAIITYSRISEDITREAFTDEFLSLPHEERRKQVIKKIELGNKELYEDVKRNISSNYADLTLSYYDINYKTGKGLKDLVNKPRHINYINIENLVISRDIDAICEFKNIILFADENIDSKHKFAAWGDEYSLNYLDTLFGGSINFLWSSRKRNEYDTFCRNTIMLFQPKFAIVVHDDEFNMFSGPKGALNLTEDDNLHKHIPVTNTDLSNQ